MKRFSRPTPLFATCLITLFIIAAKGALAGSHPAQSESGISENSKADTVHIPNTTREKAVEPVRIKNSKSKGIADTTILLNSDEPAVERDQPQSQTFLSQTPVLVSTPERVKSKGKIIAGAALFGVSYGISLFVAVNMSSSSYASDNRNAAYFYIPVLGPGIAGFSLTNSSSSDATPVEILFLGWSVAEGMGLTLLISGLVGTPAKKQLSALPFSIEPLVMKDRVGLNLRMRLN